MKIIFKHLKWTIVGAMIITIAVLCSILIFWISYPYRILDIKNSPFPVKTSKVKAGQFMYYHSNFCVLRDATGYISQDLQDHTLILLPPPPAFQARKGCRSVDVPVFIPLSVPPGKYRLNNHGVYPDNPLKNTYYETHSDWFEVIK